MLSEFLTFATPEYLSEIESSSRFDVVPFDKMAAVESAAALKKVLRQGQGKKLGSDSSWQKIKVDRQIVAIAKTTGAEVLYTTDKDIILIADDCGIPAKHVAGLDLPPSKTPLLDTAYEATSDSDPSTEPLPPALRSDDDEQA